jgi:hypothetical protein
MIKNNIKKLHGRQVVDKKLKSISKAAKALNYLSL